MKKKKKNKIYNDKYLYVIKVSYTLYVLSYNDYKPQKIEFWFVCLRLLIALYLLVIGELLFPVVLLQQVKDPSVLTHDSLSEQL